MNDYKRTFKLKNNNPDVMLFKVFISGFYCSV